MGATEAVFTALRGRWGFTRTFVSRSSSLPSGSASGTATFELRGESELLQTERGVFKPEGGSALDFSRRYAFVLDSQGLAVYFVDPKDGTRGNLFHRVAFSDPGETRPASAAGEDHLCVQDLYRVRYRLDWASTGELLGFEIEDHVRGPAKDWAATTLYEREARPDETT